MKDKQKWLPREDWLRLHNEYLRSPQWRSLRAKVLARDSGQCRLCEKKAATQVHHLTYARWRHERDFDLVSVCDDCHHDQHHAGKAESHAIECDYCGKSYERDEARSALYLVHIRVDGEIAVAGLFCNGTDKCRDIVFKKQEHSWKKQDDDPQGKGAPYLLDVPASWAFGPWAWTQTDALAHETWSEEARVDYTFALLRLSQMPNAGGRPFSFGVSSDEDEIEGDA